jgi:hypothetical protein
MSETKFTPGPWHIVTMNDTHFAAADIAGSRWFVAEAILHCDANKNSDAEAETLANLSLVAAAPEMYAALECFVDNWCAEDGASYPHYEDVAKAIEALKKARGAS